MKAIFGAHILRLVLLHEHALVLGVQLKWLLLLRGKHELLELERLPHLSVVSTNAGCRLFSAGGVAAVNLLGICWRRRTRVLSGNKLVCFHGHDSRLQSYIARWAVLIHGR